MSLCSLSAGRTSQLGLGATAVGLVFCQLDGLAAVRQLHAAVPLHFVQGLCLGAGLAMGVGALFRRGLKR